MLKFSFFIMFLGLSLCTGPELAAQNPQNRLERPISKSCNIAAPTISQNAHWAVLRKKTWEPATKMEDRGKDAAMIFHVLKGNKTEIWGYRPNVREIRFVGKSHLLLGKEQEMEFINLNKHTSRVFKNVKRIKVLNDKKQFVVLYDKKADNKLEIRDANGKLLNSLKNVSRFYTSDAGRVYVVAKTKDKAHKLLLLKDGKNKTLYRSLEKIEKIELDPDEQGIMIYEQKQEGIRQIRYLNIKSNTVFPLEEVLPITIEKGFSEVIRKGESYFLRLRTPSKEKDSAIVDIWYGNDNALVEKFYPPREVYYYWYPEKRKLSRIGSETFTRNVNIGNDRYFLSFDPFLLQDYTKPTPSQISIYDRLTDNYLVIDTIPKKLHVAPNGEYILYKKNNSWINYNIETKVKKTINNKYLKTPYFSHDGKMVWFTGNAKLWKYEPVSNHLNMLGDFKGGQITILNDIYSGYFAGVPCDRFLINRQKPLIIKQHDPVKNTSTYIRWQDKKYDTIIPPTQNHIRDFEYDASYRYFNYVEENYNLPPQWVFKEIEKKKEVLYKSNRKHKKVRQEMITYTNSEGTLLKGALYYPLNHDPRKKYPMIVHIYQKQHHRANRHLFASYYNRQGFNIRLLLENGYFVYLPDIKIQGNDGPGIGALECVNNALNAISDIKMIDQEKIGLIGHSFGGYETNFIATHSNRFAAYVAGAGIANLTQMYFSYNYGFNFPDYYRVETLQFDFHTAFANKKKQFFENNPVYFAENINAPVLLWAGMNDVNVPPDQTMAMYTALRRYHKPVIALFYKNEAHSLENKKAQADLTKRIMDWFDYFLKDVKNSKWIKEEISK